MADELVGKKIKITSVEGKLLVGVNRTLPAFQVVYTNAPVNIWTVKKGDEEGTYCLSIGGYEYVGIHDDNVVASVHPEDAEKWRIVRKENGVYVIERDTKFWPSHVWVTSGDGKPVQVRTSEFPGIFPNEQFLLTRVD